jgi:hypothetical protein
MQAQYEDYENLLPMNLPVLADVGLEPVLTPRIYTKPLI